MWDAALELILLYPLRLNSHLSKMLVFRKESLPLLRALGFLDGFKFYLKER